MVKKILKFFSRKNTKSSSAFSDFFSESSSREKTKIMKDTAKVANEKQKELVDRYEKVFDNSRKTCS